MSLLKKKKKKKKKKTAAWNCACAVVYGIEYMQCRNNVLSEDIFFDRRCTCYYPVASARITVKSHLRLCVLRVCVWNMTLDKVALLRIDWIYIMEDAFSTQLLQWKLKELE